MSTRTWTAVGTCRALDTYYVYDGLGRLRHVLPPLLSGALEGRDGIAAGDSLMAAYAWSYRYDGHGDCVWKKLPGAEAVCNRKSGIHQNRQRGYIKNCNNRTLETVTTVHQKR